MQVLHSLHLLVHRVLRLLHRLRVHRRLLLRQSLRNRERRVLRCRMLGCLHLTLNRNLLINVLPVHLSTRHLTHRGHLTTHLPHLIGHLMHLALSRRSCRLRVRGLGVGRSLCHGSLRWVRSCCLHHLELNGGCLGVLVLLVLLHQRAHRSGA